MNFTEFSFWWLLITLGVPIILLRYTGKLLNLWQDGYDRVGLVFLSLVLFWNAAPSSFAIFVTELIFNYAMIRTLQRYSNWRKIIAAIVITVNLLILTYFKYLDFLLGNLIGVIFPSITEFLYRNWNIRNISSIPPGISFYTFQMIAFLIDTVKKRDNRLFSFIDYVSFASFFPQIVAGPIERKSDLFPQIQAFQFRFSKQNIEIGLRWLVLGMFMKFVLADNISQFIVFKEVNNAYIVWLSIYLFGMRIYFDFAGYSFIARGIAKVLGINLKVNFLAPYVATNIQEFWRRWHVTLSNWFRDYVFIPLGGSRVWWVNVNLLAVFLVSGLWHGAGWNFVIWGGYHGLLLILYRYFNKYVTIRKLSFPSRHLIGWTINFNSIMFGWLFFMETDFQRLYLKLQTIVTPYAYSINHLFELLRRWNTVQLATLGVSLCFVLIVFVLEHAAAWKNHDNVYEWLLLPWVSRSLLAMIILLHARGVPQFIYFDF